MFEMWVWSKKTIYINVCSSYRAVDKLSLDVSPNIGSSGHRPLGKTRRQPSRRIQWRHVSVYVFFIVACAI